MCQPNSYCFFEEVGWKFLFLLQMLDFLFCAHIIFYCIIAKETIFYHLFLQISGKLPVDSSSVDFLILIWLSIDCPVDQLIQEILRVLKVDGTILIRKSSQSAVGSFDKVITAYIVPECVLFYCTIWLFPPMSLQIISALENKLLLAGFTEPQVLQSAGVSFIIWYLPVSSLFIIFVLFSCVWSVVQQNTIENC